MKISVCIPVYKVEAQMEKCVRSLFSQTLVDGIEFIFVDDCSPDKSVDVIRRVLDEYPSRKEAVRFIRNDENLGQIATRRRAAEVARGDYVAFCDADDWVDANLYEWMLECAEHANAEVVYCAHVVEGGVNKNALALDARVDCSGVEFVESQMPSIDFNGMCNKLYRRDVVMSFPELPGSVRCGEDMAYNAMVISKCKKVAYCPDAVYHYVVNPKSVTRKLDRAKRFADMVAVLGFLEGHMQVGCNRQALDRIRRDVILAGIRSGNWRTADVTECYARLGVRLLADSRYGAVKNFALMAGKIGGLI